MELWDRQLEETNKSWAGFITYRDLDKTSRSLDAAFQIYSGNKSKNSPKTLPGYFKQWSAAYQWVKRAEAYDAYLELLARRQREADHLKEIQEFRDRQKAFAAIAIQNSIRLLQLASQKIQGMSVNDITPGLLPSYLRTIAAVAEAATNSEAQALAVTELMALLDQQDNQ